MTTWTDELVAQLKLLHLQGHTDRELAEAFRFHGISRRAVTGKRQRLGLRVNPDFVGRRADAAPGPMLAPA